MSRIEGFEAKDPFLAGYKKSVQDVIKGMKKVGPSGLQLLIQEMIRSRWIKDRRASYPYEVAWVFDRREEAISGIMKTEEGHLVKNAGRRKRPGNVSELFPYHQCRLVDLVRIYLQILFIKDHITELLACLVYTFSRHSILLGNSVGSRHSLIRGNKKFREVILLTCF